MRRLKHTTAAFYMLVLASTGGFAQNQRPMSNSGSVHTDDLSAAQVNARTENLVPLLKQLTMELKNLRLELLEQRLESQEENILELERELRQLRAVRGRLEEQERAHSREMAQLDERLAASDFTEEERLELEASKTVLLAKEPNSEASSIAYREAALHQRLEETHQRREMLLNRLRKPSTEAKEVR